LTAKAQLNRRTVAVKARNASLNVAMKKHTMLNVSVLATLLASLLSCVGIATEEQQKSTIPGSVLANFPGYHLLTLKERDSDTGAFLAGHFPKSNPSVVHGRLRRGRPSGLCTPAERRQITNDKAGGAFVF